MPDFSVVFQERVPVCETAWLMLGTFVRVGIWREEGVTECGGGDPSSGSVRLPWGRYTRRRLRPGDPGRTFALEFPTEGEMASNDPEDAGRKVGFEIDPIVPGKPPEVFASGFSKQSCSNECTYGKIFRIDKLLARTLPSL